SPRKGGRRRPSFPSAACRVGAAPRPGAYATRRRRAPSHRPARTNAPRTARSRTRSDRCAGRGWRAASRALEIRIVRREEIAHVAPDGVFERRERRPVARLAQALHLRLGEILEAGADLGRDVDVDDLRRLARGGENRERQILEAPRLAGAAIEEAVHLGMVVEPEHHVDAVADPDEIAPLPAIEDVRPR